VSEALSQRFLWMASKETDEFDSSPTTFIEDAGKGFACASLAYAKDAFTEAYGISV
jgi:hypothetical protein